MDDNKLFKETYSFTERKKYFQNLLEKYEGKIQVIIETHKKSTLPFMTKM